MKKIILLLFFFLMAMAFSTSATILCSDFDMYYSCDNTDTDGGKIEDATSKGNAGNISLDYITTGIVGNCPSGECYYQSSINGAINITETSIANAQPWSVSMWLNHSALGEHTFFGEATAGDSYMEVSSVGINNRLRFESEADVIHDATWGIPDNQWAFVVIQTDGGGNLEMWVDSILKYNSSGDTSFVINAIGNGWSPGTNGWIGNYDEVGIKTNGYLTPEEILERNTTNKNPCADVTKKATYANKVIEIVPNIITLSLAGLLEGVTNVSGILNYNNTEYNTTVTTVNTTAANLSADVAIQVGQNNATKSFFFDYTIDNSTRLYSKSYTQEVFLMDIDNCSNYTVRTVDFFLKRSIDEVLTVGDIGGFFTFWQREEPTITKTKNISVNGNNNMSICIWPTFANYSADAQLEYTNDSYDTFNYWLNDAVIENVTQSIDLLLTNGTTLVEFAVTDENDRAVQDVYINILIYDFTTDSFITSEIIKTDESGEALGNIVLNTQWYKFILVYQGNTVLETDPIKLTTTSRNFRINLETSFFDFYNEKDDFQTALTFTNSTLRFQYTFVNPTGTPVTGCLKVIRRRTSGDHIINESCVTSASGNIAIGIGPDVGTYTYIGHGSITVNPGWYTDVLTVDFDEGYKEWGLDGIYMTFFVRLALASTALWHPIAGVVLVLVADIFMIIAGLYTISWNILVVYVILGGLVIYRLNQR